MSGSLPCCLRAERRIRQEPQQRPQAESWEPTRKPLIDGRFHDLIAAPVMGAAEWKWNAPRNGDSREQRRGAVPSSRRGNIVRRFLRGGTQQLNEAVSPRQRVTRPRAGPDQALAQTGESAPASAGVVSAANRRSARNRSPSASRVSCTAKTIPAQAGKVRHLAFGLAAKKVPGGRA